MLLKERSSLVNETLLCRIKRRVFWFDVSYYIIESKISLNFGNSVAIFNSATAKQLKSVAKIRSATTKLAISNAIFLNATPLVDLLVAVFQTTTAP